MAGEWRTVTFQQLIDDGLLEIGDGYRAQNHELGGTGPIFLRAGHVTDTHIDFTGVEHFHNELTDKLRPKMSQVGDTIITTKGNSTGRTSFVTARLPPFVYSPHLSYWRTRDAKKLCGGFLRYWSQGIEFVNQLSGMKASTDMAPYLSLTDQRRLTVTLPPLAAQQAIAAILGALDDKIELNRRMNATLDAMARALFQSWFVDFDPVRAKLDGRQPAGMDAATAALFPNSFQESPAGQIPLGWEVKPLSELCQLGRGSSPRPINDYMNGDVPWVKIADATGAGGPFLFETKERVTKAGAEKSVAVAPGDLILSNSATCGVPMFVELHGCIHDGWLYFKNLRSITKLYLFHLLMELAEHLVHIADGSVQKNLNTNLVGQQKVLVPPPAIVHAFDSPVTDWFAKMRQNGLESRTLAALRDALLPKLLSGELRIKDAELFVGGYL